MSSAPVPGEPWETFDLFLTCAVYRQANNINMLKDGMKIEATHVKKKQLHQYLPAELVQKKKRVRDGAGGSSSRCLWGL